MYVKDVLVDYWELFLIAELNSHSILSFPSTSFFLRQFDFIWRRVKNPASHKWEIENGTSAFLLFYYLEVHIHF